jgi:DNA-binding GntR family transcriptional regulator
MTDESWTTVPTMSRAVADWIATGIVNGRWTEGEHLRELDIAAELGISRAPIREAVRILSERGLVNHRARSGAVVKAFSTATIRDVYAVRATVESWITRCAVPGLRDSDIEAMGKLLPIMRESAFAESDRYFEASWSFRQILYGGYPNPEAMAVVNSLRTRLHSLPQVLRREQLHVDRSLATNETLHQLARESQAEKAAEVMRTFLLEVGEHMCEVFTSLPAHSRESSDGTVKIDLKGPLSGGPSTD